MNKFKFKQFLNNCMNNKENLQILGRPSIVSNSSHNQVNSSTSSHLPVHVFNNESAHFQQNGDGRPQSDQVSAAKLSGDFGAGGTYEQQPISQQKFVQFHQLNHNSENGYGAFGETTSAGGHGPLSECLTQQNMALSLISAPGTNSFIPSQSQTVSNATTPHYGIVVESGKHSMNQLMATAAPQQQQLFNFQGVPFSVQSMSPPSNTMQVQMQPNLQLMQQPQGTIQTTHNTNDMTIYSGLNSSMALANSRHAGQMVNHSGTLNATTIQNNHQNSSNSYAVSQSIMSRQEAARDSNSHRAITFDAAKSSPHFTGQDNELKFPKVLQAMKPTAPPLSNATTISGRGDKPSERGRSTSLDVGGRRDSRNRNQRSVSQSKSTRPGEMHSVCFVWGSDKHGQLGQNSQKRVFQAPKACIFGSSACQPILKLRVTKMDCGDSHTALLTEEGMLYMFGSNQGQRLGLGLSEVKEVRQPTLIEELLPSVCKDQRDCSYINKVVDVCCASSFTLAVTSSGHAFSWGSSAHGALGLGRNVKTASRPTLVEKLQRQYRATIVSAVASCSHSLFLSNSGKVFAAGRGDKGQLCMPPEVVLQRNMSAAQLHGRNGSLLGNGRQFGDGSQQVSASSQNASDFDLFEPHQVHAFEEVGSRVAAVAAGRDFSLFLTESRDVFACGANEQGQLGVGDSQEMHAELQRVQGLEDIIHICSNESSLALDAKGKLYAWGPVSPDKVLLVPNKIANINKKVVKCAIGKHSYAAIDTTGMVWVWGENKSAQLGLNDYTARQTPYPLLSLKEKAISHVAFGNNYAVAVHCPPVAGAASNPNSGLVTSTARGASQRTQEASAAGLVSIPNPAIYTPNQSQQQLPRMANMKQNMGGYSPEAAVGNTPQNLMLTPIFNESANGASGRQLMQHASCSFPSRPDLTGASQSCMTSYLTHSKANLNLISNGTANSLVQLNNQHDGMGNEGIQHTVEQHHTPMLAAGLQSSSGCQTQTNTHDHTGMQATSHFNNNASRLANQQLALESALKKISGHPGPVHADPRSDGVEHGSASRTCTYRSSSFGTSNNAPQAHGHYPMNENARSSLQRSDSANVIEDCINDLSAMHRRADEIRRGGQEVVTIEDQDNAHQLAQLDQLAAQYEEEMQRLRESTEQQKVDLHTMIETVGELKSQKQEMTELLDEKDNTIKELQMQNEQEKDEIRRNNQAEINALIEQIDMLTRKIDDLDEQHEAPRKALVEELERKTHEVGSLDRQLAEKQKALLASLSEAERYKIQVTALHQKVSDMQVELSSMKEINDQREGNLDIKKLREAIDFERNMTQSQKLTIERLQARLLVAETGKSEVDKLESTHQLEKGQLQRQIQSLENQLRFQTNLNENNKKEMEKMDQEISQVTQISNDREQILQKKLEESMDAYRQEKVTTAGLRSQLMERENLIEQLRVQAKQSQADVKLARLENDALVKQCEYERQNVGRQVRDYRLGLPAGLQAQSPGATARGGNLTAKADGDGSYLDMSYSQSPSILMTNKRRAASRGGAENYNYQNYDNAIQTKTEASYNSHLLKSLEKKTMHPLMNNYTSDTAGRSRAAALAEADRMVERSQRLRGLSDLNDRDDDNQNRARAKSRGRAEEKDDEEKPRQVSFNMRDEARKFQDQVKQNMEQIARETMSAGAQYKRVKSLDPRAAARADARESSQGSRGSGRDKKEGQTYIQKLLGLGRTSSASSQRQYPFQIPPWQKLLKGKHEEKAQQVLSGRPVDTAPLGTSTSEMAVRHNTINTDTVETIKKGSIRQALHDSSFGYRDD